MNGKPAPTRFWPHTIQVFCVRTYTITRPNKNYSSLVADGNRNFETNWSQNSFKEKPGVAAKAFGGGLVLADRD